MVPCRPSLEQSGFEVADCILLPAGNVTKPSKRYRKFMALMNRLGVLPNYRRGVGGGWGIWQAAARPRVRGINAKFHELTGNGGCRQGGGGGKQVNHPQGKNLVAHFTSRAPVIDQRFTDPTQPSFGLAWRK